MSWASPREFVEEGNKMHSPAHMGSPYVPLDSWIYPALERLAAMGYMKTAMLGIRPWTRLECARLVSEAVGTASLKRTPRWKSNNSTVRCRVSLLANYTELMRVNRILTLNLSPFTARGLRNLGNAADR